jgi:hypothetical protein
VESFLKNTKSLTDVHDIYYGLLLQNRAKEYGIKSSDAFKSDIVSRAKSDWLSNFNADTWSYTTDSKTKGLTLEGLKVAEMLAYTLSNNDLNADVTKKLRTALNKLVG